MNTLDEFNDHYEGWLNRRAGVSPYPLIPAATAILLRDGERGLETLLLRRSAELSFVAGMWVFPGGRTDPADYPSASSWSRNAYSAAMSAAARETHEETGLRIGRSGLIPHSHWLPPTYVPQQFATWFFLAKAPGGRVRIDRREAEEATWLSPAAALERHAKGALALVPPTYVTLLELTRFESADEAMRHSRSRRPPFHETAMLPMPGGGDVAVWEGDAAYDKAVKLQARKANAAAAPEQPTRKADVAEALAAPGARHRLWMPAEGPWRFERASATPPAAPTSILKS